MSGLVLVVILACALVTAWLIVAYEMRQAWKRTVVVLADRDLDVAAAFLDMERGCVGFTLESDESLRERINRRIAGER